MLHDAAHAAQSGRSLRAPRGTQPTAALAAGAAALGAAFGARASACAMVAQNRDADGPMVDRALEIVRQFIVARGLILFGGLAIDYALRLKGGRLYPDGQRPDFDVFSMRSVDDAYDLADILHAAGFADVGAIRAIHVQTMKVRTDYLWVADIGHVPADVYATIPTFDYQGMRVVHPDFQRMDIHLAFCFPYSGAPREDVYHRWRKDLRRFADFEIHYPIGAEDPIGAEGSIGAEAPIGATPPLRKGRARVAAPIAGAARELRAALHGFAAYAALRAALDELAEALGATATVRAPRLEIEFPDERTVVVELPAGDDVVLATPWPAEVAAGLAGLSRCAPYLDLVPESWRGGGVTIMSTRGRQLAAGLVRVRGAQCWVVTPHYLMLWLLAAAHTAATDTDRAVYRAYYRHMLEIIRAAEQLYAAALAEAGEAGRAAVLASYAMCPFAPMLTTIGGVNQNTSYVIKMANLSRTLRDTPPAALNLDADIAELLTGLPDNYYPAKAGRRRPAFSYDSNPLFLRSGQPIAMLPAAPSEAEGSAGPSGVAKPPS
jgi:hypothetical protein